MTRSYGGGRFLKSDTVLNEAFTVYKDRRDATRLINTKDRILVSVLNEVLSLQVYFDDEPVVNGWLLSYGDFFRCYNEFEILYEQYCVELDVLYSTQILSLFIHGFVGGAMSSCP